MAGPVAINAPTSIPNGAIWAIAIHIQAATGVPVVTPPGGEGWSTAASSLNNAGASTYLFWKEWNTGEPTTASLSFDIITSYGCVSFAYTGAHVTTPFGTATANQDTVNDTTLNGPALTTTGTDSISILVAGIGSNSITFSAIPAGYTLVNQAAGKRCHVSDAPRPSPATIGADTYTTSLASRGNVVHIELFTATAVLGPALRVAQSGLRLA